jgi:hypothetical protein
LIFGCDIMFPTIHHRLAAFVAVSSELKKGGTMLWTHLDVASMRAEEMQREAARHRLARQARQWRDERPHGRPARRSPWRQLQALRHGQL